MRPVSLGQGLDPVTVSDTMLCGVWGFRGLGFRALGVYGVG